MNPAISIYIHIPYCLQRCRYCDFTTFEISQMPPAAAYVELVREEIRRRHPAVPKGEAASIYFGGGTPSLLDAEHIVAILAELANAGFSWRSDTEITIEINPATLTPEKIRQYVAAGINRFSVGAQTFSDALLTLCGRKHSADDTRKTLELLNERGLNYSFDLLFALPGQTMTDLRADLREVIRFRPPHLSAYCLTVPEGHPMSTGRPLEAEQVAMFDEIETALDGSGILKYEISNFARPGFESRHNLAYWTDRPYWGIGLSAHSYFPAAGEWGIRFWNPKSLDDYRTQVLGESGQDDFLNGVLPPVQRERLLPHESLTDFCHMFLRTARGLPLTALRNKFGATVYEAVWRRLNTLADDGLVHLAPEMAQLTNRGQLLSNVVFAELLFSAGDWT
jgi:oxygen-independent coproporphyrinogen III oxidase